MRLSDETLRGRTVIGADGNAIGSVAELFISTSDWRVESLRIELRNEVADRIGASRTMFRRGTIELPSKLVQSVGDAVVLSVNVEQLREAHRSPAPSSTPQPAT